MQQSTKQRVVGILVILITAAVLLPVVFDGEGSYQLPLESRIPEAVPFPSTPVVVAERPVIIADTDAIRVNTSPDAEEVIDPDATQTDVIDPPTEPVSSLVPAEPAPVVSNVEPEQPVVRTAETPSLDNVGLPQGWSVRLASFSSQLNALTLVDRLQERGHKAYTREVPSAQGILIAVFVGPGVDRAAMQRLQQQLRDEFQLNGMVVRYEIEDL